MDTDSLYLDVAEQDLYDCIRPEFMEQWEALQREDCTDLCFCRFNKEFLPSYLLR